VLQAVGHDAAVPTELDSLSTEFEHLNTRPALPRGAGFFYAHTMNRRTELITELASLSYGEPEAEGGEMDGDILVSYGGEVKALGNGKVGGYLVRYGTATETDREGDYFTPETDFAVSFPAPTPVYFHHGLEAKVGVKRLGQGTLTRDETGVWIEALLDLTQPEAKAAYLKVTRGEFGWSSGAAAHLVRPWKGSVRPRKIEHWPLGTDASLTSIPAEPRNVAVALKSLPLPATLDLSELSLCDGETLVSRTEALCVGASGLKAEYGRLREFALKEGRALSTARRTRIQSARDSLAALVAEFDGLLAETEPASTDADDLRRATDQLRTQMLRRSSRLTTGV
jgi:hypothetical protein